MAAARPIRLPSPDFDQLPLPVSPVAGFDLLRVHGAHRQAVQFQLNPAHRFSHPDSPGGLLYLAGDLGTCLWECFGDAIYDGGSRIARATWENRRLSRIFSAEDFRFCDLTDLKVRGVLQIDLSASMHTDLAVPHAWALAIQNHSAGVDGLRYLSRFSGRPCLALFERPGTLAKLRGETVVDLPDSDEASGFLETHAIALV